MEQQQGLQTLRSLNRGKSLEVQHNFKQEVQMKSIKVQQQQIPRTKQKSHSHDHHQHGQACSHGHDHGSHKGHGHKKGGHDHGPRKNYCIMIYTIFTCLSCLYLQTQHLNPYRGDYLSRLLSYLAWFDVFMCLWSYIQTYRIKNTVKKLSKILNVDTVQNKIVDPKYHLTQRHCEKCNFYKFPRVSHCSTCGQCIYKLDHHCMWTQTCIGHCNQRPFLLFCIYMSIGVFQFWISTYRAVSVMYSGCNSGFFNTFQPGVYILWAMTCLSAGVVGMMIVGLCISHCLMVCTNFTTLDSMKQKRMFPLPFIEYRPSNHSVKAINPYDRGQIQNLRSLFGTNILTFWLPFGRQIQNEFIIEPMNPQPTKLQLMRFTTLYDEQQNIQRQVERVIPHVKQLYKGKQFSLDGQKFIV